MLVNLKFLLAVGLLLFQIIMIGYARFVPTRFFCWAPFDSLNLYQIQVTLAGKVLTPQEIKDRYRIESKGTDHRAISHVLLILKQYEETYGRNDNAHVQVVYSVNGRKEQSWEWPTR